VAIEVDDRLKNPSLPIPAWRAVPEDKLYIGILCRATRVIKAFFLEKKNQKKPLIAGCGNGGAAPPKSKSFLLLFFKKEALA
jgi:hypothetical protein